MNHRHLGQCGLVVSEISYGNWITHASQVEKETAIACVRAAVDEGITTFDTADIYAMTKAEDVLGEGRGCTWSMDSPLPYSLPVEREGDGGTLTQPLCWNAMGLLRSGNASLLW